MAKDDSGEDKTIERLRNEPRPDFSQPPPRKRLPKALQDTLDDDEKLWETLYDGNAGESTDSSLRYAGYASRVRTILLSAHRYVAYTSDIGESFRPIAHPFLVRGAYGVSWAYLIGDVAHEGYKAYLRNQRILHPQSPDSDASATPPAGSDKRGPATAQSQHTTLGPGVTGPSTGALRAEKVPGLEDYRTVMAQRAVFQGVASMGLPAFTIHSVVKYSGKWLKNAKNTRIRTWGPIGLGLAVVPFLPYMFDHPIEQAVEWTFYNAFKALGGEKAVGNRPAIGRAELRQEEQSRGVAKDKEL
ncbi:hypothetical protein K490DRAFT_31502 [Saccharata proteae CBS 121410]|uniref:Mitochondrial fission process protein 1 n=1 Tax=Saccharata proteae CBS 121410 TaxID=1314787 RepID=A0A9P4I0S3_9PEZI|nr:hypothetical protein K490DRAFT_31502 [Saccharata proteae CBS 121410]